MGLEEYTLTKRKFMVAGAAGVGKSTSWTKTLKGRFIDNYNMTIGLEVKEAFIIRDSITGEQYNVWEVGGQKRFKEMTQNGTWSEGANAIEVVYDNRRISIEEAVEWTEKMLEKAVVRQGKKSAETGLALILVENKIDLVNEKEWNDDDESKMKYKIGQLARKYNAVIIGSYKISSKTGEGWIDVPEGIEAITAEGPVEKVPEFMIDVFRYFKAAEIEYNATRAKEVQEINTEKTGDVDKNADLFSNL